jgi:cellulose synthase/poly-beta-1,6-N-acetylglucosamine synthase-like glycosyltransferase
MRSLLLLYVLIGPVPWVFFGIGMLLARHRMNRLRRPIENLSTYPTVTVLIPAKDEGERVQDCLNSVLALDYPNFKIIAIDDRSTDNTGVVLNDIAEHAAGRVAVIHINQGALPEGWLGKCNALQTAAAHAKSDWLLFIDSDVKVAPDALSGVLALAVSREYAAVSILTKLDCPTFWEKLILPLCAASVSTMCLISQTNDDNRTTAFANGQFFLIKRSAYEAVGGHTCVRDHITEDVALARILKSKGFRTRLYMGAHFASTRMHTTLRQMRHGWGRIFSGVSSRKPWRILAAIDFVGISGLSAYAALAFGIIGAFPILTTIAAAHLLLITLILASLYHWSGNQKRYALLFLLAAFMLLWLYTYALKMCITGKVAWRGTSYTYTPTPT